MSNRSSDARRATSAGASGGAPVVAPGAVAPVGRRVLAFAVDSLLLVLASVAGLVIAGGRVPDGAPVPILLPAVLCLVVAAAQWIAESFTGATAGSALLGIRTLSVSTGRPAGLLAILVRQLVVGAGALMCLVGQWVVVASGVWDTTPSQRGWHDKAAGTLVLRAASASPVRGVPGPAAWDEAMNRTLGGSGGRRSVAAPSGPVALAPISVVPGVPLPGEPVPDPVAPAPVPMIDVPTDLRPTPVERSVAPDLIAAPPETAPAVDEAADEPVALIQGLPPAVRSRRELRQDGVGTAGEARPSRAPLPDLGDLELTRLRESGPAAKAAPGVRLVFDTGERLDVVGDGLVGRSPSAEDGVEHVVAIDDPERSISKVHLAFGPTPDGGLWVMDRGSTNGTVLVAPDGSGVVLPAGARVGAAPGTTIRFGQRSARVERA